MTYKRRPPRGPAGPAGDLGRPKSHREMIAVWYANHDRPPPRDFTFGADQPRVEAFGTFNPKYRPRHPTVNHTVPIKYQPKRRVRS